ncbi:MAG: [protein-PII] uridylyltransferase [Frankiaceae bacterium]
MPSDADSAAASGAPGKARLLEQLRALRGRSDIVGPALRRVLTATVRAWLTGLFEAAGAGPGISLVTLGGYGRGEPAPGSDLDLVLVHDGRAADVGAVADRLWYPIWDTGISLDHSVRTVDEALRVAAGDLRAALGLLDVHHVAGDEALSARLRERTLAQWRSGARKRLPDLRAAGEERARTAGDVAFLLEPDLKTARGGLRDMQVLRALAAAWVTNVPAAPVQEANVVLLDVRGELHKRTRGRDKLLLQEQDGIAAALGYADADALAHAVADAGRKIAWAYDSAWRRAEGVLTPRGPGRRFGRSRRPDRRPLADGVVEQNGEVVLARDADPATDPVLVLRAAEASGRAGVPLAPHTLERLAAESAPLPTPWHDSARDAFIALLATGPAAVGPLEALDHAGLLVRLLPEWRRVRSKPQRNAVHRFTVDRHLLEAVAEAAGLTRRVERPDLLLLAALLHDIGKGWPGDHVAAGQKAVARIGPRLGLPAEDAAVLTTLAAQHLLLPEIATRRDLDDPATIRHVAGLVGSRTVLDLLHALTEADALATGPAAWGPWKARLVGELVERVGAWLGGAPPPRPPTLTAEQEALLSATAAGDPHLLVRAGDDDLVHVTVAAPDQVGLLAAIAGVVALHRLDVRRATAYSRSGRALSELVVSTPYGRLPDETKMRADLVAALGGSLSLDQRLREREESVSLPRRPELVAPPPEVLFDDSAEGATVVEVRAQDGIGVLHRIVAGLAGHGLDVRTAIVSTLGADVVDAFYVRGRDGGPLPDGAERERVAHAVLAALG